MTVPEKRSFFSSKRWSDSFKEWMLRSRIRTGLIRRNFNNREFWNHRYDSDMERGAGIGSRGSSLKYKRELLRNILEEIRPESILDVGCGDLNVGSVLPARKYTGIDISDVVIEKNRGAYPDRAFFSGNFLEMALTRADLTISFDVLIHLPSGGDYRAFVQKLVSLTGKCGIISGYESMPKINSPIIFFHEPLSHTLRAAGAHSIQKAGEYQQATIFMFTGRSH